MSVSYTLFIQTALPVEAVLQLIFEPKTIFPLEGTDMLYARGTVFLAHAQALPQQMQDRHASVYGFPPTLSIRYFPDGVSSFNTSMDLLAQGICRYLHENDDRIVLSASKTDVLKRLDGKLTLNTEHNFWKNNRLKMIDLPYFED